MISDEEAKAFQAAARLTSEAGGFFARTFGGSIKFIAQAIEDKAEGYFLVNRVNVVLRTRERLERLDIKDIRMIEPRTAIPLMEAISEEPDETLQDVWAAYIANSLDPSSDYVPDRQLIGIIRQLEPIDTNILSRISLEELREQRDKNLTLTPNDFELTESELNYSLERLTGLGLFSYDRGAEYLVFEEEMKVPCKVSVRSSLGEFSAMPLLLTLQTAITEPKRNE